MPNIARIILHSSEASEYSNYPSSHNINLYYNEDSDPWSITGSNFYQLFFNSKDRLLKEFSFPTAFGRKKNGSIKYTKFNTMSSGDIERMLTMSEWFYCTELQEIPTVESECKELLKPFNISEVLLSQWKTDISNNKTETTTTIAATPTLTSPTASPIDIETTTTEGGLVGTETITTTTTTYEAPIVKTSTSNNIKYPSSNMLVRKELMSQNTLYNLNFNTNYQTSLSWLNLLHNLDHNDELWKKRYDQKKLHEGDNLVILMNFTNKNKFTEEITVRLNFKINNIV